MQPATADGNRRLLNRTGAAVAVGLVIILAGALYAIMVYEIPEKNHDIVLILITTVCNAVIGVTGYFFGSSVSSRNQGEIIATQAATQQKLAEAAIATPLRLVTPEAGETRYQAAVRLYGANSPEAKAETPP